MVSIFHLLILRSCHMLIPKLSKITSYPDAYQAKPVLNELPTLYSRLQTKNTINQSPAHTYILLCHVSERPVPRRQSSGIIKYIEVKLHQIFAKCPLHSKFIWLTTRIRPLSSSGRQLRMVHSHVGGNLQPVGQEIWAVSQILLPNVHDLDPSSVFFCPYPVVPLQKP